MKKLLVVVDMQKDFIDGALGTKEAEAIVPAVVKKIQDWDGDVIATMDTHGKDYMETREGKYLPVPHCIKGTPGWEMNIDVLRAVTNVGMWNIYKIIQKPTFGSEKLVREVKRGEYDYVELIGLCTDICLVNNALLIKAALPEIDIAVDSKCCAGVTPAKHEAALETMRSCQIDIL